MRTFQALSEKRQREIRNVALRRLKKLEKEIKKRAREKPPLAREKLLFFKWESLRRNPHYRDFYSRIYPAFMVWLKKNPTGYNVLSQFIEDRYLKRFGLVVGLNDLPNPDIHFEDLKWKDIFDSRAVRCLESECVLVPLKKDLSNLEEVLNPSKILKLELAKKDKIRIEVDLGYKKTEILRELDKLLTTWVDRKKEFDTRPKKLSIGDGEKYFKAYDLRTKEGKNFQKIAEIIFPKEQRATVADPRNFEKLANDYYHRVKALIEGAVSVGN